MVKREVRPWRINRTDTSTRPSAGKTLLRITEPAGGLAPRELRVSDYRDQALIVWHHGDDNETAQLVRVISAEVL